MFDIVTTEPEDKAVMTAVEVIKSGKAKLLGPKAGYRFIAVNDVAVAGCGGAEERVLVIVDWRRGKDRVFLVACLTAGVGTKFVHGNFANEVKAAFRGATVWASEGPVSASTLAGDWLRV
jgi:hypothetical protein